ncbi:hypothetical protein OV203_43530 [Nannocystis sp. ILAH1]|uniref:hypothetical protein n=1 Tax=unclassified Nannocystis TaxID=2627009 RepID=UPI00226F48A7|nr:MULTISPECIES: hypothetical protein [unclassified Nannocystis]MCY0994080.1 hypothetical protein [Nannocystis sp. ILAH1]MCY1067046.1 hypothetical protein [Nannocystis sp. RBIL2]
MGEDLADITIDLEKIGSASRDIISTYYKESSRTIYARGEPEGTYNVQITSKTLLSKECENLTPLMSPVPQKEITVDVCGGLGLIFQVLNGGVSACVMTHESNAGVPVYHYNFTSLNVQLNYNVVDIGNNMLLGTSGWQPALDNDCPRDGFPY